MNNRFIEIYSKNRNRSQFPLISDFTIPFASTYQISNPNQAQDPIINGMIYYSWISSQNINGIIQSGFLQPGSIDASPIIDPNSWPIPPSDIPDAYIGYIFFQTFQSEDGRLISGYDPQTGKLKLQLSGYNVLPGTPYQILDYSTASFIHLPFEDKNGNYILTYDQAYNGYYIIDETISYGINIVGRRIYYYDNTIRFALLDSPFPSQWDRRDTYTIRQELPLEKWKLNIDPYFNKDPSYGPIGYVITLPNEASDIDNFYKDKYIYNTETLLTNASLYVIKPILGVFYIKYYKGSTREAFVNVTQETLELLPKTDYMINIVNYKKNNFSPLDYTGSLVSVSSSICYEITLIELTLPNVILKTGSRIAFYPYVYVELTNLSASEKSSTSTIYSNNPKSNKAVFIAPVTDIVEPIISKFVKLGSNSMTQIIKFKPTDSFKFSIYLPNGKLFEPVEHDLPPPYAPYDFLQSHAVFSIKRLDTNEEEYNI
jgi:hypothetical protein